MKKQYFINANIIDPHNSINEIGGLIISEDGKIEAIGKKVNTNNLPSREKTIDLKGKYIFPGKYIFLLNRLSSLCLVDYWYLLFFLWLQSCHLH